MSKKTNCELVKDLLPVYADGLCSEESRKTVAEHIMSCESCRRELEMMKTDLKIKEQTESDIKNIKKIKRKIRIGKIIAALAAALIVYFITSGLLIGVMGMSSEYLPMNYERNHLSENIFAEEDSEGKVWIVRKSYATDGTIDYSIRPSGSGIKKAGPLIGIKAFSGKHNDNTGGTDVSELKNAEKIDLVITLAERKFEHWLNNADTPFSDDERGLLFSRMNSTAEIAAERNMAVDTTNQKSKICAIYYYDPETDTEKLLWEKK